MNTVLETIRELLKFKNSTTIAEIASYAGLPRKKVLEIINANGQFVWRNRKNGHITKVDPTTKLKEELWESGKYYRFGTFGAWSVEGHCIEFKQNDELRKKLEQTRCVGALGDNWNIQVIYDTPENVSAVEAAGLKNWETVDINDRLWKE